jgi:transcriptional regulator with XRE-family HTH domain
MKTFGDKLKEARLALGWTQAALAEKSGIPLGTIREYEQNKREPLLSKAGRLARALKQPVEAFLEDKPAEVKPAKKKGKGK